VQYTTVVNMLQREYHLSKPVQDLVFLQKSAGCFMLFDLLAQVPAIRIVHYNAQLTPGSLVDFSEANDARVVKNLKNLRFSQCRSSLFITH